MSWFPKVLKRDITNKPTVSGGKRAALALKGAEGKRLTYHRQPHGAANI
jgi:hypothetical protein